MVILSIALKIIEKVQNLFRNNWFGFNLRRFSIFALVYLYHLYRIF
jgi:hypothetical protein